MSLFGSLASVSLAEMTEQAGLMTRFDTKCVLGEDELSAAVGELGSRVRILRDGDRERFRYLTVYFDDPSLRSYRDHAMERARRFKTRIRRYEDSGDTFVEAKMRLPRGQTVKTRRQVSGLPGPIDGPPTEEMTDFLSSALGETLGVALPPDLVPTLVVAFERTTLLTGSGERATVDSGLTFSLPGGDRLASAAQGRHVTEVKSPSPRSEIGRVLARVGARPMTVSKYCMGLGLGRDECRANAWRPAMRRLGLLDVSVA